MKIEFVHPTAVAERRELDRRLDLALAPERGEQPVAKIGALRPPIGPLAQRPLDREA